MSNDTVGNVMITQEQISKRAAEIAREIEKDFCGQQIVLVGILRGEMCIRDRPPGYRKAVHIEAFPYGIFLLLL